MHPRLGGVGIAQHAAFFTLLGKVGSYTFGSWLGMEGYWSDSKLEKKADFQSEMSIYDNLLKYVDKFLGELRKQLRDGKFTEDGYNDLVSEYNDVISRYNSFIN